MPNMIALLCTTIYSNVDTTFVGKYVGNLGLTAMGIFMPIQAIVAYSVSQALSVGASVYIAPALGRGDINRANILLGHLLIMGLVYITVLPVVFLPWLTELIHLIGSDEAIVTEYALRYGQIVMGIGPLAYFGGVTLLPLIRNENRPIVAMILQLTSAILNILLDAILFPLTSWYLHVQAASIATCVSNLVTGLIIVINYSGVLRQGVLRFKLLKLKDFSCRDIWGMLSVGIPQFLVSMPTTLTALLGNTIISRLDITPWKPGLTPAEDQNLRALYQGAYSVSLRIAFIVGMPLIGISQSYMSILGYNLGARMYRRSYKLIGIATLTMFVVETVFWACFEGIAYYFVGLYIGPNDDELRGIASKILRLSMAGYPLLSFMNTVSGIAQLERKSYIAIILQLVRGLLTIAFEYFFPYFIFKGDISSMYYCYMVGDITTSISCIFLLWYYLRKYKKLADMEDSAKAELASGHQGDELMAHSTFLGLSRADPQTQTDDSITHVTSNETGLHISSTLPVASELAAKRTKP